MELEWIRKRFEIQIYDSYQITDASSSCLCFRPLQGDRPPPFLHTHLQQAAHGVAYPPSKHSSCQSPPAHHVLKDQTITKRGSYRVEHWN